MTKDAQPCLLYLPTVRFNTADEWNQCGQRVMQEMMKAWACRIFKEGLSKPDTAAMAVAFNETWHGLEMSEAMGWAHPWDDKETVERKLEALPSSVEDPRWPEYWAKIKAWNEEETTNG
jgi:hypothetical protein